MYNSRLIVEQKARNLFPTNNLAKRFLCNNMQTENNATSDNANGYFTRSSTPFCNMRFASMHMRKDGNCLTNKAVVATRSKAAISRMPLRLFMNKRYTYSLFSDIHMPDTKLRLCSARMRVSSKNSMQPQKINSM